MFWGLASTTFEAWPSPRSWASGHVPGPSCPLCGLMSMAKCRNDLRNRRRYRLFLDPLCCASRTLARMRGAPHTAVQLIDARPAVPPSNPSGLVARRLLFTGLICAPHTTRAHCQLLRALLSQKGNDKKAAKLVLILSRMRASLARAWLGV